MEFVLYQHPAVLEAAVFGSPDPVWGEAVTAAVVRCGRGWLSEEELVTFCRPQLAAFKLPRQIRFLTELPKTGSGKILKRALRSADAGAGEADAARVPHYSTTLPSARPWLAPRARPARVSVALHVVVLTLPHPAGRARQSVRRTPLARTTAATVAARSSWTSRRPARPPRPVSPPADRTAPLRPLTPGPDPDPGTTAQ